MNKKLPACSFNKFSLKKNLPSVYCFHMVEKFYFLILKPATKSCFFRWFKNAGEAFIKVPFFGAVSYLTLAVSPFCITFAVVWAVYRNVSFAWIGQDILVSITFSTVSTTMFIYFHKLLISSCHKIIETFL